MRKVTFEMIETFYLCIVQNKWQLRLLEPEKEPEQFMQLEEPERDYKLGKIIS